MKPYLLSLLLGLLCINVNGEKIHLEDIERDNLRAEDIFKAGNAGVGEPKYLAKPEIGQQRYQVPNQYQRPTSAPVTYVTPSSVPSEAYVQSNKYVAKEQAYQQQNDVLPEQTLSPRYYNDYRQQSSLLLLKGIAPNVHESQQLVYQPEVNVGNHIQAAQQSTVTAKYAKDLNKGTVYVDVPMMHILTYYPNLEANSGKTAGVPRVPTATPEHISIPFYTTTLNEKLAFPVKPPAYQVQLGRKYNTNAKGAVYTGPSTSKRYSLVNVPTYVPSDQSSAQGRQFLYTQAYITPPHQQYASRLVYAQPTTVYTRMHGTPVYNDVNARPPTYVQDNSLQGKIQYAVVPEHPDSPAQIDDELPNQMPSQSYVKEFEEPSAGLVPPQILAQDFKPDATPLLPVSSQDEEPISEQNHVDQPEARSLLDSYVPSKLIAAQDVARYQERPIRLESGFLPSKENFVHEERKIN